MTLSLQVRAASALALTVYILSVIRPTPACKPWPCSAHPRTPSCVSHASILTTPSFHDIPKRLRERHIHFTNTSIHTAERSFTPSAFRPIPQTATTRSTTPATRRQPLQHHSHHTLLAQHQRFHQKNSHKAQRACHHSASSPAYSAAIAARAAESTTRTASRSAAFGILENTTECTSRSRCRSAACRARNILTTHQRHHHHHHQQQQQHSRAYTSL